MPSLDRDRPPSKAAIWREQDEQLSAAHSQAIANLAAFLKANLVVSREKLDEHMRLDAIVQKAKALADAHQAVRPSELSRHS
jgi:hypothetical protein